MVERPIKKSELQKRAQAEGQTSDDKNRDQKNRKGGRGQGRHNTDRDKKKPAVPLALMRGPKPMTKVDEPEPTEAPEETTIDGEGTEAVAEAAEAETDANTETSDANVSEASEVDAASEH